MRPHVEEAKKRRDEKLRQTRGRQSWILAGILAGLAVVIVGGYFLINSDVWLIKSITVTGNDRLSSRKIIDLSGVDNRTSLLRLPAVEITARLKKNPWVKNVKLFRSLPNRLTIQIAERKPFVGLKQGDHVLVMDKSGFVVQSTKGTVDASMPVIGDIKIGRLKVGEQGKGATLAGGLKSLSGLDPELKSKVTWVSIVSLEKLTFQTSDGVEIVYGGPQNAAKKNYLIKKILSGGAGKIVHVNVTAPDNPVVRKVKQ